MDRDRGESILQVYGLAVVIKVVLKDTRVLRNGSKWTQSVCLLEREGVVCSIAMVIVEAGRNGWVERSIDGWRDLIQD